MTWLRRFQSITLALAMLTWLLAALACERNDPPAPGAAPAALAADARPPAARLHFTDVTGASGLAPILNGRPLVDAAVRDVAEPDVEAEYVNVRFSYVPPDELPLGADLFVTGSFNRWAQDPANELTWMADEGRYEGEVLMKQGQYEYRYLSRDPRLRRALQGSLPRNENLYTAFVYFSDITKRTDRLLAVNGLIAQ